MAMLFRLTPHFRQRLKVALAAADMTAGDLANKLDVSHCAVSFWVNGKKQPNDERLLQICMAVGCGVNWLLEPTPVDVWSAPMADAAARAATTTDLPEDLPADPVEPREPAAPVLAWMG